MENVFNLCDIWNKTDWIYKSVSLWESFITLWGLRAGAVVNNLNRNKLPMGCCWKGDDGSISLAGAQGMRIDLTSF